jgi:hypothetical protein
MDCLRRFDSLEKGILIRKKLERHNIVFPIKNKPSNKE